MSTAGSGSCATTGAAGATTAAVADDGLLLQLVGDNRMSSSSSNDDVATTNDAASTFRSSVKPSWGRMLSLVARRVFSSRRARFSWRRRWLLAVSAALSARRRACSARSPDTSCSISSMYAFFLSLIADRKRLIKEIRQIDQFLGSCPSNLKNMSRKISNLE